MHEELREKKRRPIPGHSKSEHHDHIHDLRTETQPTHGTHWHATPSDELNHHGLIHAQIQLNNGISTIISKTTANNNTSATNTPETAINTEVSRTNAMYPMQLEAVQIPPAHRNHQSTTHVYGVSIPYSPQKQHKTREGETQTLAVYDPAKTHEGTPVRQDIYERNEEDGTYDPCTFLLDSGAHPSHLQQPTLQMSKTRTTLHTHDQTLPHNPHVHTTERRRFLRIEIYHYRSQHSRIPKYDQGNIVFKATQLTLYFSGQGQNTILGTAA